MVRPILQALVLAERIYTDEQSKEKIICGTFNKVTLSRFSEPPHQLPDGTKRPAIAGGTDPGCPSVYISLTDVIDGTELTLQFVNVSKSQVLFENGCTINKAHRLATIEMVLPLPPFREMMPEAGTYSFEVLWKGEILGSHRVLVEERPDRT
ncbi:MAG: hypothetical protein L0Y71_03915 [Gemmataceae bacterium]|nr:hypothetical protein [Gemmataceae bacterium]